MTTVRRVTYGIGGFDKNKLNDNVTDTGTVDVPDPPAGVPAAFVVIRNRLTGQGQQPTDTQVVNALAVIMARVVLPDIAGGN